jgi:site-specific DNA-cytosine methylase
LESAIPDALESLSALLRLFIGPREAQAIITFMAPYGPDNVPKLWEALSNVNVPLNRRRMIIESWCVSRSLPIPDNIRSMFNLEPYSSPSFPFGPQPQKREDLTVFQALVEWEKLKQTQQPQPQIQTNPLESQYQAQVESLRQEVQKAQENYRVEVEKLREELHKKEMETLNNEIKRLESEVRRIESFKPVGDYKMDEFRLLADSLATISKKEPLDKLKEMLPQILSMAYGVPQEKAQTQQQARVGLIGLLRQKGLTVPQ